MKIYFEYILLYLIKIFALIVSILTCIILLIQFLSLINYFPNIDLGAYVILKFLALEFPTMFSHTAPIALMCALIYVYHILYADNIMSVLETNGISKRKLAMPGVLFGVIVTVVCVVVVMVLEPLSKRELYRYRRDLANSFGTQSMLEPKSFNKLASGIMMYLDSKQQNNSMSGVIISDHRERDKQVTFFAKTADIIKDQDILNIVLNSGSRNEISKHGLSILYFDTLSLSVNENNEGSTRYLSMGQKLISELALQPEKNRDFHSEIHHRISLPLLNIVVAMVAMAAMLYGHHGRRSDFSKIKRASVASLAVIVFSVILKNQIFENHWFAILLYLNMAICMYLALYVLNKSTESLKLLPKWVRWRRAKQ